jgi:hypothetical protein
MILDKRDNAIMQGKTNMKIKVTFLAAAGL